MDEKIFRWVRIVVFKLIREKRLSHLDVDTLLASGYLGYSQAKTRYDSTRGASFKHFAEYRIRGAVLDEVRKAIGDERCKNKRPRQVEHDFTMEGDDAMYQKTLESQLDIEKFFEDIPLDKRDKEILRCRINGMNLKEIGDRFGFCESRASQVLAHIKSSLYPWFQDYLNANFKIVKYDCPECHFEIETAEFSTAFDCERCGTDIKIVNGELRINEENH